MNAMPSSIPTELWEAAKILVGIVVAYLVYRLALRAYFRQKEFENVRKRYLECGLELVCSQIDYALGVYRHNWMLLLRVMKQYRDIESQISRDSFFAEFVELDQSYFQITPMHKINVLLGDQVVWEAYQRVFSFVGTSNDKIKSEFGSVLKVMLETPEHPNKQSFLNEAYALAKELDSDSQKFSVLLARLQELAEVLERENLSRKGISNFSRRKEAGAVIQGLRAVFPADDAAKQDNAGAAQDVRV